MNIDLVLKRLELIKESKGINTISDVEASIILNKIERLNNIIEDLKAILKSKGYEVMICNDIDSKESDNK